MIDLISKIGMIGATILYRIFLCICILCILPIAVIIMSVIATIIFILVKTIIVAGSVGVAIFLCCIVIFDKFDSYIQEELK